MEAEARYTVVGVAVLLLIAALVGAVLWLAEAGGRGETRRYAIHFEEQALDGLQVGADVKLRGIKVGRVDDYALAGETLNRVRVTVRIDRRAPVRTNTVAVVTRNLVTGIASITLINVEPAGPPLTEVAAGESLPVIGEGRSDLDQITGRVSEVGELASQALSNLNQLLTAENRAVVMQTVRNLRDLSAGLSERLDTLDQTLASTGAAAKSIAAAAGKLGSAGERIAAVAEGAGRGLDGAIAQAGETFARTNQSLAQVEKTLAEGERTLADTRTLLDRATVAVDGIGRQATSAARQIEASAAVVEDQLAAAIVDLRLSLDTAARVLDRLQDPRAALLGPAKPQLGPGETKP